jgi:hypothetical protein
MNPLKNGPPVKVTPNAENWLDTIMPGGMATSLNVKVWVGLAKPVVEEMI